MSAPCYLHMRLRTPDLPALEKVLGGRHWDDEEDDNELDGVTKIIAYEANYAWDGPRRELAKRRLVHEGYHGDGGNYGQGLFLCTGSGKVLEVAADNECYPVVQVNDNGRVDAHQLRSARRFLVELRKVEKLLAGGARAPAARR